MASPAPAPSSRTPRRGRLWLPVIGLVILIAAAAVIAWAVWFRHSQNQTGDPIAAAHANDRGVGHMEQFEYAKAASEFEEASRLAPDWLPAKINLGIALYNSTADVKDPVLDRAAALFQDILARDPDNPYAHFNLGVISKYRGDIGTAAPHFEAVTRIDPTDPHAWLFLGQCDPDPGESPRARECFQKALALNPYLNAARHMLMSHAATDPAERDKLTAEFNALVNAPWQEQTKDRYTEFGRYAAVIGGSPAPPPDVGPLPMFEKDAGFKAALTGGAKWAGPSDLGGGAVGELRKAVRDRFGGVIVRLDYDRDGKTDLLLLSAVVRSGRLTDLLLHNDGNGAFTDATEAAGLGKSASFGCSVGDFDNDGLPDLLLTGPDGVRLLRNEGGKTFADRTADAGFDKLKGVFLGSAWVDIDQDGDLDALLAKYADNPEAALDRLKGKESPGGGVVVMLNVGEAPPAPENQPLPPLTCKFRPAEKVEALAAAGPVTTLLASDLDADRDTDLLLLLDGQTPAPVLNDRLLRFHRGDPLGPTPAAWNGALVLDANGDEQSDLLLLPAGGTPVLLVSRTDAPATATAGRFTAGAVDSPPLLHAEAIDVNLDGRTDVVGLSQDRKPVLLQGDGRGKLTHRHAAFGPDADALSNLVAVTCFDLDGDCNPDLLAWSADGGLVAFHSRGAGGNGLPVALTGVRKREWPPAVRTNADGVGVTVSVLAGPLRTGAENTTLSAGLGQSRGPILFGLAQATAADTIRLRWPDGVPQAELNFPACQPAKITETDRRSTSCPVLFTWDGTRFRYVTDFLGAGSMGESSADGSTRPPRPEESVKIEPGQLAPKDGRYVLKVSEPMDEVLYIDHLRLDAIDHPADVAVHPDERFATGGPDPTQELLAFRDRLAPVKATDHRGRDVTATLRDRDGKTVDRFAHRSWLGFAEDHFVDLEFGDRLAGVGKDARVFLVLAGWTDYPFPESIFAAEQAGVPMTAPVLERQTADGKWQQIADLGLPAGLPKVMTREVPGLAGAKNLRLRVRTNLQIFWDQVYLAPLAGQVTTVTQLPVAKATLAHRGFAQEVAPNGRKPVEYSDDRTEPVLASKWHGRLTRLGDVTPLLTAADDKFVVYGPGEEITAEFDAAGLPPLKPGWVRSFVLRSHGYSKDTAPFTKTGGRIEPLPFRGMGNYPDGATDRSKAPPDQAAYDREWNTRPAGR